MDEEKKRQKAWHRVLIILKDPKIYEMALEYFRPKTSNMAPVSPPEQSEPDSPSFSVKDKILFLLATASTVATFMMPRTPVSVTVGTLILFGLLIHPALYLPYVLGKSKIGRRKRRYAAVLLTALIVGTGGYFAWAEAVHEVAEDVKNNLEGSVSLYPDNAYMSDFTFTNGSGREIISKNMSCVVYEAYMEGQNWVRRVNLSDPSSFPIKAGKDSRSTECFQGLLRLNPAYVRAPIMCADVSVAMDYELKEFPHSSGSKERRFLIRRTSSGYVWALEAVSAKTGYCSGDDLSKRQP